MSHGWNEVIINTQERAISTDINRLQRFKEKDLAEVFRHMFDVYASTDDDQLGTLNVPNTLETPLRAEILGNGLLVRPQGGSLNLLVDSGVMMAIAPDAALDESDYKFIRDDGVTTLGALTIAANASGSTRIDVIECRINTTALEVFDNRDVYNPTTGLFSATSLVKERRGRLEYRVRQGTPGSGMPANQSGWLPLAVASVPNGTTTVDTVTFWDVRPLLADRESASTYRNNQLPKIVDARLRGSRQEFQPAHRTHGYIDALFQGRRVGGRLRRGTPGTDADYFEGTEAANQDGTITAVNGTKVHCYLAFPYSLPRWARYTDGPANRVPRSPKGIPIVSTVEPNFFNQPSSAITLPTSTGLGGSTSTAMCIYPGEIGSTVFPDFLMTGRRIDTRTVKLKTPPTVNTTAKLEFNLTPGTDFPSNTKVLRGTIFIRFDSVANATILNTIAELYMLRIPLATATDLTNSGTALITLQMQNRALYAPNNSGSAQSVYWDCPFEIVVPEEVYPLLTPTANVRLVFQHFLGITAASSSTIYIHGYDI
jgi:hypothetical protein